MHDLVDHDGPCPVDRLRRPDRNGSHQAPRMLASNGLYGREECRAGGEAVVDDDDESIVQRSSRPSLPVQLLSPVNLLSLHRRQILNVRAGEPKLGRRLWIHVNVPRFADRSQRVFGISGRSNFPGDEHIQRKMKVPAHRIPDGDPSAWERSNDGVWTVSIPLHREREPMSCVLAILEDHALLIQPP
jgi:hypothetical protein